VSGAPAAFGEVPDAPQGVEGLVATSWLGIRVWVEEQIPFLGDEEENDSVDDSEQLTVQILWPGPAGRKVKAQLAVSAVGEKAGAECLDGFLHAVSQVVESAGAGEASLPGPAF
jgi:hypothetical protein